MLFPKYYVHNDDQNCMIKIRKNKVPVTAISDVVIDLAKNPSSFQRKVEVSEQQPIDEMIPSFATIQVEEQQQQNYIPIKQIKPKVSNDLKAKTQLDLKQKRRNEKKKLLKQKLIENTNNFEKIKQLSKYFFINVLYLNLLIVFNFI